MNNFAAIKPLNVHIWNEYRDDRDNPDAQAIYPYGIHYTVAEALVDDPDLNVTVGLLDDEDQGLSHEQLMQTDVLIWWAHHAHTEVNPVAVEQVVKRVKQGMGFLVLHSAHFAEPFIRLMGTTCRLRDWHDQGTSETLWAIQPSHPVLRGVETPIMIPHAEMYGEPFDVPPPDDLLLISSFSDGNVFRSGCVWRRGKGRILYFRPGHETFPIYHNPSVKKILHNAVRWLGGRPS